MGAYCNIGNDTAGMSVASFSHWWGSFKMWFSTIKILNPSVQQVNTDAHITIFQNMEHCIH